MTKQTRQPRGYKNRRTDKGRYRLFVHNARATQVRALKGRSNEETQLMKSRGKKGGRAERGKAGNTKQTMTL